MWGEFCKAYSPSSEEKVITRKDGLSYREGIVMDNLTDALNSFRQLSTTHPSEDDDFVDGIHKCQQVLMNRILRRDYPLGYPSYDE